LEPIPVIGFLTGVLDIYIFPFVTLFLHLSLVDYFEYLICFFFLIYLLQRKLLSLRLELKHVTLTCQDHDTKPKRKTSLPSKIEGIYSHYAATLSFVPEFFE
jgi:hypothetical protein